MSSQALDGDGEGGPITITAGRLDVRNVSFIISSSGAGNTGAGGDIALRVDVLKLTGGSRISTETLGTGAASRSGNLTVKARESVTVESTGVLNGITGGSQLGTGVLGENSGNGGRLTIRTPFLEIRDGGAIDASTSGGGRGGNIELKVGHLALGAGGVVRTATLGAGAAGDLTITATSGVTVTGRFRPSSDCPPPCGSLSGAPSSLTTFSGSEGPAGRMMIRTPRLEVSDGSIIMSSGLVAGPAGRVSIVADVLSVSDAQIQTAGLAAEGGLITVRATDLISLVGAEVISDGIEPGAGDSIITLEAPTIVLNSSEVTSLTGGEVIVGSGEARLRGDLTVISPDSEVAASSSVEVSGLESDITAGIEVLPGAFFDVSAQLRESCAARQAESVSSFVRTGQGGVAAGPDALLPGTYAGLVPTVPGPVDASAGRLVVAALGGCDQ